ncbi:phage tail protein, partial [Escherichia coli]|nr:phage tail protein [Escherichia coli]
PVRITRASQATELWGRGSMIALMVAEFIAINPDAELYAIAQGNGTGQSQACLMNIIGTATQSGVLHVYIGGRRYLLAVTKGQKGRELIDALVTVINADADAPFSAYAGEPDNDQNGQKGTMGINARFTGECSVHDIRVNYHDGETTPGGL